MKKQYTKPAISFENFAFTSNVAGACANLKDQGLFSQSTCPSLYGTYNDPSNCEFYDNGFAIFLGTNNECAMTPQEDDPNNLCYHISTAENRMFAS